jgi:hypothetical protein
MCASTGRGGAGQALPVVLQEIAVPYLNCSRCGLSLRIRFAVLEPENCPRCLARSRVAQPLFRSPLTFRELTAADGDTGGGTATEAPRNAGAPDRPLLSR